MVGRVRRLVRNENKREEGDAEGKEAKQKEQDQVPVNLKIL